MSYQPDDEPPKQNPKPSRTSNVDSDYVGKEVTYDKVERLSKVDDVLNMELFYNQQITNLNMSWILRHPKTGLSIVGISQEHTYGFSVENTYNSGAGGAYGQAFSSLVNSIHGKMHDFYPIRTEIGEWGKNLRKLGGEWVNSVDEAVKKRGGTSDDMSIGESAQNIAGKAAMKVGDVIEESGRMLSDSNSFINKVAGIFFKGGDTPTVDDIAAGKMVTSTDKVLTYGGSNLSITLPVLKTFVFHNPISEGKNTHNVLDLTSALTEVIAPKTSRSSVKGLYALQHAPGGFKVNLNAFTGQTEPMEGTWELVFNGYTIKNLLVSNLTVNYSKYNAMNKDGMDSGDPLYAEIDITLAMASMLMSDELNQIMMGTKNRMGLKSGSAYNSRKRFRTSGWDDSDNQFLGVTSKSDDIAVIGTNRRMDSYSTLDRAKTTSY